MKTKEHDLNFAIRTMSSTLYVIQLIIVPEGVSRGYAGYCTGTKHDNRSITFSEEFMAKVHASFEFFQLPGQTGYWEWRWMDTPVLGLIVAELNRMEAAGLIEGV